MTTLNQYARPEWAAPRKETWYEHLLPQRVTDTINQSPLVGALARYMNSPMPDLTLPSERDSKVPMPRSPSWFDDRPVATEALDKFGLLANFIGPGAKLPARQPFIAPGARELVPGRYRIPYKDGELSYKMMDDGTANVSIYTMPEGRGQGQARNAFESILGAADAAKQPLSLEISPGAAGVDRNRLRQWYERSGFEGPDHYMVRQPTAPKPQGIRAYHGSPHDFDRFDMSKIGTGEGAQAYGRGLYFAESEGVAKSYRQNLSRADGGIDQIAQTLVDQAGGDWKKALQKFENEALSRVRSLRDAGLNYELPPHDVETLKALRKGEPGRMYEVKINADPETFLDWDKPLSQQSDNVKAALQGIYPDGLPGGDVYQMMLHDARTSAIAKGNNAGTSMPAVMQRATDDLRSMGVPGIKYLDQGSRAAGQGSRNFVVFDDALVTILRKYGLLPPAAVGTMAATNGGVDDGLAP